MSNVAPLINPVVDEIYLGTATVLSCGEIARVRLEDGREVDAGVALAVPYVPADGDVLVVIGRRAVGPQHARFWAVGVVHGRGKTQMAFKGDVELRAVGGSLELRGDHGIRMAGPEMDVTVDKLRVAATSVVQKCTSFYQRVRGLMSVRAEQQHTVVDKSCITKAARADIVAEHTVTINGEQIHLG